MSKKGILISVFAISAISFVVLNVFNAAKTHIKKQQENLVLNNENNEIRIENRSLKIENNKLKDSVIILKNEIQKFDSIKEPPKIIKSYIQPDYMPYRIFTNDLSDSGN